jgi:hypothetical protein
MTPGRRFTVRPTARATTILAELDVRIQRDWTFNTWALQGYLDIQNVTNRSNPEASFYNFDFRDKSQIKRTSDPAGAGLQGDFLMMTLNAQNMGFVSSNT